MDPTDPLRGGGFFLKEGATSVPLAEGSLDKSGWSVYGVAEFGTPPTQKMESDGAAPPPPPNGPLSFG